MDIQRYVPILRTKRAEHGALKMITTEARKLFTPLYDLRKAPVSGTNAEPSLKNYILKAAKNCAESWTEEDPIIFDTPALRENKETEDGRNAIELFYSELSAYGIKVIPTISTDRTDAFCTRIQNFSESFVFRVQSDDLNTPTSTVAGIRRQLNALKVGPEQCHLLIDLKFRASFDPSSILDLTSAFTTEIGAEDWKSVTFAGCNFPEDMSRIRRHTAELVQRKAFECWRELNQSHLLLGVKLQFGDYGIINPVKPDLDGVIVKNIPPKIRYTTDREWLIFRGDHHEDREDNYDECQRLAYNIVNHESFKGAGYSWGDKALYDCSTGKQRICGLEKWIKIDLNHHITLLSQQVTGLYDDLSD